MVALDFDSSAYPPTNANDEPRWVMVYHDALNAVRTAGKGSRNEILNAQAFIIGRIVAAGHIKEKEAQADLEGAAADAGIMHGDERAKSIDTIKRGLVAGAKNPWEENGAGAARLSPFYGRSASTSPTPPKAPAIPRGLDRPNDTRSPAMKDISPESATGEPITKTERARVELAIYNHEKTMPVVDTIGQAYLKKRGISIAPENLRYSNVFHGLSVPLIDSHGKVTALHRIPINKDLSRGRKITQGKMSDGVFKIAATNPECNIWVVTDGPEDALTCAEATGWHAAAVCGKARMYHIVAHVPHGATVVLCRDADEEAGPAYDRALRSLRNHLCTGIIADPPGGFKDPNDLAQAQGVAAVREWLERVVHGGDTLALAEAAIEPDEEPLLDEDEVERLRAEAAAKNDKSRFPEDLPAPSGMVKDVMDYILKSSLYQHPVLALGAALITIGTIAGRRFSFDGNIRPNLYILGLAPSSSGKNHILDSVERLLSAVGMDDAIGGREPASGTAITSRLVESPVTAYCIDEFGMLLRAILDPKSMPHVRDIAKVLTEVYTRSAGRYSSKDRADRKMSETIIIQQPSLSVFGITNAVHVWDYVTPAAMMDGSLGRFLVMETDVSFPDPNFNRASTEVPPKLRDDLRGIIEATEDKRPTGLSSLAMAEPLLRPVAASLEARMMFQRLIMEEVRLKRIHEARGTSAIWGRMVEMVKKLSLIHAIGRDPALTMVEECDVTWAESVVRILINRLIKALGSEVSRNDHEKAHMDVLKIIRENGKAGIEATNLTRRTQWLKAMERKDIIDALLSSKQIVSETRRPTRGKGRGSTVFVARKY